MAAAPTSSPPPFVRLGPAAAETPLVLSVPHAGRHYPAEIERDRAVSQTVLEGLEDRYADRLVLDAVAAGAVAIVATHARAWIDLNRGEEDAAAAEAPTATARARAGLGLVPSRAGGRPLWRRPIDAVSTAARLATVHAPYHRAIAEALTAARARHGVALLIDCHSMPPLARPGRPAPRIVVGDLHGASADREIAAAVIGAARARAIPAAWNTPYAGAFTLQRHGQPAEGVHAIQIEIDRSLYLAPGLREAGERIADVSRLFAELCEAAEAALGGMPIRLAAE